MVKLQWFKIGIQLGVPYHMLQEFKEVDDPLVSVFDYCLRGIMETPLTWQSIIDALESCHVDEGNLADKIRKKYCLQKDSVADQDYQKHECKGALTYKGEEFPCHALMLNFFSTFRFKYNLQGASHS